MMQLPQTLDEMLDVIRSMTPADRAAIEGAIGPLADLPWVPQPGPQRIAYFHDADEMLYGGAAGGGKTDLVAGLALTAHRRSLILRRQSEDLDGLWDRIISIAEPRRLISSQNSVKKKLGLTDGRVIEMGHLDAVGAEKRWQGNPHDLIAFDEAAQLDEHKVLFVLQWLRTTEPGQRVRAVFATNPPIPEIKQGRMVDTSSGMWLKAWFAPWVDPAYPRPAIPGEIRWVYSVARGERIEHRWVDGPGWYDIETGERYEAEDDAPDKVLAKAKSRTFIRSLVDDNAYLKDSGYKDRLSSTPEPLRSMLRDGRFGLKLADHAFQVIPTNWVLQAQHRWTERMKQIEASPDEHLAPMLVLAADIAQGGIDSTVLAALREDQMFDPPLVTPGSETPTGTEVVQHLLVHRRNEALIVLDGGGGWGGSTRDLLATHNGIDAHMVVSSGSSHMWANNNLWRCANTRSEMWWSFREALDPDSEYAICLPPSDALAAQLTAPHFIIRGKDMLIESKEDLRKRLGSSTDEADAVLMAWFKRKIALTLREEPVFVSVADGGWNPGLFNRAQARDSAVELDDPLAGWDTGGLQ